MGLCFVSVSVLSRCSRERAACALLSSVRETRLPGNALFSGRKGEDFLAVPLMKADK